MDVNYLDIPEYANLLSLIPFGEENAIKRHTLVQILGTSDRENRKMISKLRTCVVILNSPSGGYFRPDAYELYKIKRFVKQEKRRAISNFKALQFAEKYLADVERRVLM